MNDDLFLARFCNSFNSVAAPEVADLSKKHDKLYGTHLF